MKRVHAEAAEPLQQPITQASGRPARAAAEICFSPEPQGSSARCASSPRQLQQRTQISQLQSSTPAQATASASSEGGLPGPLRQGIESLSGLDMSGVRVHRNSSKPAALQAHAYAQGTDIHLGPGQERHLPHEAWHVVQQAQGRVRPTMQMAGGVAVNDDRALEIEADAMGKRALQERAESTGQQERPPTTVKGTNLGYVQRVGIRYTLIPGREPDRKWELSSNGNETKNFNTDQLLDTYRDIEVQDDAQSLHAELEKDHPGLAELAQAMESIANPNVANTLLDFVVLIEAEQFGALPARRVTNFIKIITSAEIVGNDIHSILWLLVYLNRFENEHLAAVLAKLNAETLNGLQNHDLQGFTSNELELVRAELGRRKSGQSTTTPSTESQSSSSKRRPHPNDGVEEPPSTQSNEVVIDLSSLEATTRKSKQLEAALKWEDERQREKDEEIYGDRSKWYQMLGGFPTLASIASILVVLIGSYTGTFANATTFLGATLAIAALGVFMAALPPIAKSVKSKKYREIPLSLLELVLNTAGVALTQLPGTDVSQGQLVRNGTDIVPANTTYDQAAEDAQERTGGWSSTVKAVLIFLGCLILAVTLMARIAATYKDRRKEEKNKKTLRERKKQ